MSTTTICSAIASRAEIEFTYDGERRVVQPAACGTHRQGKQMESLRGYQIAGGTTDGGPVPGWRMFTVASIANLTVTKRTFTTDPPGYSPNDKHLIVRCEL